MNEMSKTGAFLGVALVLSGLWWVARPKVEPIVLNKLVGEVLFPNFTDPADAANLQIVRYSEELAELSTFEVEKNGKTGLWNIPTTARRGHHFCRIEGVGRRHRRCSRA